MKNHQRIKTRLKILDFLFKINKLAQSKRDEKRRKWIKKCSNGKRRDFTKESSVGSVFFAIKCLTTKTNTNVLSDL